MNKYSLKIAVRAFTNSYLLLHHSHIICLHHHSSFKQVNCIFNSNIIMRAVVAVGDKTVAVQSKEIPNIEKDEVLVKVIGVSLNPTDCMFIYLL